MVKSFVNTHFLLFELFYDLLNKTNQKLNNCKGIQTLNRLVRKQSEDWRYSQYKYSI